MIGERLDVEIDAVRNHEAATELIEVVVKGRGEQPESVRARVSGCLSIAEAEELQGDLREAIARAKHLYSKRTGELHP